MLFSPFTDFFLLNYFFKHYCSINPPNVLSILSQGGNRHTLQASILQETELCQHRPQGAGTNSHRHTFCCWQWKPAQLRENARGELLGHQQPCVLQNHMIACCHSVKTDAMHCSCMLHIALYVIEFLFYVHVTDFFHFLSLFFFSPDWRLRPAQSRQQNEKQSNVFGEFLTGGRPPRWDRVTWVRSNRWNIKFTLLKIQ